MWLPELDRGPDAYGYRKGIWRPRDLEKNPLAALIWHTTGSGVLRRFERDPVKHASPFEAALWVFRNMKAGPHIVIGQGPDEIAQVAPLDVVAWHVGKARSWGYFRFKGLSRSKKYDWWRKRWHPWGVQKPADLAGGLLWRGKQCNPNTLGIEVVPPFGDPQGEWSEHCWRSILTVARLGRDVLGVPIDPLHQLGHSDAHPVSRTAKGKGWDPSPEAWDPWRHCRTVGQFV